MTSAAYQSPYEKQSALWILRIFSRDLGANYLFGPEGYTNPGLSAFLGLPPAPQPEQAESIIQQMETLLKQLEADGGAALEPMCHTNLAAFTAAYQLSPVESAILGFFVVLESDPLLRDALEVVHFPSKAKPETYLARILGFSAKEIEMALHQNATLRGSGLIECIVLRNRYARLHFFDTHVAIQLIIKPYDPSDLLASMGVTKASAPELELHDYPHLQRQLHVLLGYLRKSLDQHRHGVNVLLYGPPGTGKTQLTRVIAHELGIPAYDFSTSGSCSDPKGPTDRLRTLRVSDSLFVQTSALFVFDEFEDVLKPVSSQESGAESHKGWFNRVLESNSRPIFWVSNSIDLLDAAFCRRFDFILEVTIPPRSARASLLRKQAGQHLTESTIQHLANHECLAPAVVTRVTQVVDAVATDFTQPERNEVFVSLLDSVLKAQGHHTMPIQHQEILPDQVYDVSCLNTDADLAGIAAMLRQQPNARLCLHGPPGTGKTAFGHWLAREIDRPLHLTRASDWLNAWVGGTEQRIANSFQQAVQEHAVLMIDEVDSFLRDRAKAVRSWEVTQVNELLTRMETFNGVLIATTNRLEHLDAASLRRFDLKLHFDFLHVSQIRELLRAWCRSLGILPPLPQHLAMIESLPCVTPGDFAAAARRHRFLPFRDAGDFLLSLAEQSSLQQVQSRRIGF